MYNGLLHAHSGLRWVALLLLLITVAKALSGWLGNKPFTPVDRKWAMFALISVHTQLLIGIALLFVSPNVNFDMSVSMENPVLRFFTMEHNLVMLIAIVLITIGNAKSKRANTDKAKHKTIALFFLIGLVLILAMIPWPFRDMFAGRGWF